MKFKRKKILSGDLSPTGEALAQYLAPILMSELLITTVCRHKFSYFYQLPLKVLHKSFIFQAIKKKKKKNIVVVKKLPYENKVPAEFILFF